MAAGTAGLPGCRAAGLPDPGGSRTGTEMSELLGRRLMEQRVVLLHGPLDDATVTRVSAELMTLDADGDDAVTLRIDCGEAALAPALTLMDVVELMGVPVRAVCLGQVGGGAVGVLAVCAHRAAMPSTRFTLSEPATQHGGARAQRRPVGRAARRRARALLRAGGRGGREVRGEVGADIERGRFFGAAEALEYGLLDEVCGPDADVRPLPGSGPRHRSDSGRCADTLPGLTGPCAYDAGDARRRRTPNRPACRRKNGTTACAPSSRRRREGPKSRCTSSPRSARAPRTVPPLDGLRRRAPRTGACRAGSREIVILRTAYRFDGFYEWAQHVEMGQGRGVTLEEIEALGGETAALDAVDWAPLERAALRAVDETARARRGVRLDLGGAVGAPRRARASSSCSC